MNYDNYESRIHISPAKAAKRLRRKNKRNRTSAPSPISRALSALRTVAAAGAALFAFCTSTPASAQTLIFQPTTEATSKDTKIYVHVPTGLSSDLNVTSPDIGAHFLSLVQFDISSFLYSSNDIISASLTLYSTGLGISGGPAEGGIVTLSPVLNDWRETPAEAGTAPVASYNAFFGTSTLAPTLYAPGVVAAKEVTGAGFVTWDITTTVRGWVADPSTNHGLLIQLATPGGDIGFADVDSAPLVPGSSPALTIAVPEPGSMLLALAGAPLLLIRRRRSTAA